MKKAFKSSLLTQCSCWLVLNSLHMLLYWTRWKYKLQRLSSLLKLNEPLPQYVQSTHHLLHSGFRIQFTNQLLKHLSPKAVTDLLVNESFYRRNFTSIIGSLRGKSEIKKKTHQNSQNHQRPPNQYLILFLNFKIIVKEVVYYQCILYTGIWL